MAAKSTGTDILDMEQNYFNLTLSSDYQVCTRVFFLQSWITFDRHVTFNQLCCKRIAQ